jgi:class 3 adenylate cyclase
VSEGRTATVTVLFCDLVDSTALATELGDVAADEVRREVFAALRSEVTANRGTEVKHLGDGLMVSFASNADAARTACAMQQRIDALGHARSLPLALRVGISAGEATFEDEDWFGTPVVEASRLCSAASAGQVLVADVVRVLLGSRAEVPLTPVGELELKGLPVPLAACEIDWSPIHGRDLGVPLPRAFSLAPRFSLAGRDHQLDQLLTAWKEAVTGPQRAVLVAGEPGIGKTRLAAELARTVDQQGGFVLLGRCDEGLGVPYQPFVEALSHVVAHAPPDRLAEMLGSTAGELCRLVPELTELLPATSPTRSDPETERYLLFEAIAGWLQAQSQVAPTLLVLDDLHWAAEPTLHLLRHVLRSDRDLRLLVIGTYRDTEIDRTHPLGSLLADLRRGDGVERLALRGLDADGMAQLVEVASGHELHAQARELADAVHAETGGNPFFAIEVLVSLAERGAIYQDADGAWRSDLTVEEVGIPEGVKEVVGQRLNALPDGCEQALHAAAVAGQEFELDLLAAVIDEQLDAVIDSLEAARVAGLLDELGGMPVRYRFAHALVQQTLLDELPTARRLRLHRTIAEAIEQHRGERLDRYRAALARHWYEAGTEPRRALEATAVAAATALDQFADREALQWLARSRELLDDADTSLAERIDIMTMHGEALRRVGDPAHREVLLEAGRLAKDIADGNRMARAALANGRGFQSDAGGVDTERVHALADALVALGDEDPSTRALLLVRLAVEKVYEPDAAERLALADEAITIARSQDDPVVLAGVLSGRHNVIMSHETIEQRRSENAELRRLADASTDPRLGFFSHAYGYFWQLELCRVEGARASVAAARAIAERLSQPELLWIVDWPEAGLARLAGDLERSEALNERALQIGSEAGIPDALLFYAFQRANLIVDRADPAHLAELRTFAELAPPHYPVIHPLVTLLETALGQPDQARRRLEPVGASPHAPWSPGGGQPDSALVLAALFAAAEAALGEASPWTSRAYDYLDPWRGQLFGNVIWHGPTESYLAAIAPLAGHPDELDDLVDTALTICEQIDAPINRLYACLFAACAYRTRRRTGDRDRADRLLAEAVELGDRTGAGIARAAAENFPALQG